MTWIICGLVLLLLIVYFFRKSSKSNDLPILEASIITDDGFVYKVVFKTLNPELTSIEYVRLILSFISKVYYISDKTAMTKINIKHFLGEFSKKNNYDLVINDFSKILNISETDMDARNSKSISAISYYVDIQTRKIYTKIPSVWYENQMFFSVIALILESQKFLSDHQKDILFKSFKKLDYYYQNSDDSENLKGANLFPNKAFVEATLN